MQLLSFRVRNFRNINDSGDVHILDPLNCIVGKNQSGKTSLLKALHKFNPHQKNIAYDINKEWPRGRRRQRDANTIVCECTFALDQKEHQQLTNLSWRDSTPEHITIGRRYDGQLSFIGSPLECFPDRPMKRSLQEAVKKYTAPNLKIGGHKFISQLQVAYQRIEVLVLNGEFGRAKEALAEARRQLKSEFSSDPSTQGAEQSTLQHFTITTNELLAAVEQLPTCSAIALKFVLRSVPIFVYMDEYREFSGRADLEQLSSRLKTQKCTREDETILMLLNLAGLDLNKLIAQGKDAQQIEERQHDLQDGARNITQAVSNRWGQHKYKLEFRVDGQTFFANIEEIDKGMGMVPFEEQSQGFKWFFSFDLHFMHDSESSFKNCVLLLDEPGLHLHPGGQSDLLKRLDAYAELNTLIYTTHLPFLVDLREPKRLHIMTERNGGAEVTDNLSGSGSDERLTLQAALGMTLGQHFLVSQKNLVVEGVDDFWILSELSSLLTRSALPCISDDILITAAGGASELVYLASYMIGQNLDVFALFDSDDAGRKGEEKLRTKWLTKYKNTKAVTALIGEVVGAEGDFTLEDLFSDVYYLQAFERTHADKLRAAGMVSLELPPGSGNVRRLVTACESHHIRFNKASVAKSIRTDIQKMKSVDELDAIGPALKDNAAKIVARVAEALCR
ncbi:MAG: AAA family ATPase [Proteobacteria bacterium]|nr:AAA family ATPase [Pseudomonadota bacterium]